MKRATVLSLLLLPLLTACATVRQEAFYDEDIKSVLLSSDKKQLALVADRYSYIVTAPAPLVSVLQGDWGRAIATRFDAFHVGPSGQIRGAVHMVTTVSASEPQREAALAAGFVDRTWARGKVATFDGELVGVRIATRDATLPAVAVAVNPPYRISLIVSHGGTPQGGVGVVRDILWAPVYLVGLVTTCNGSRGCF